LLKTFLATLLNCSC